jgi:hypothetical protein
MNKMKNYNQTSNTMKVGSLICVFTLALVGTAFACYTLHKPDPDCPKNYPGTTGGCLSMANDGTTYEQLNLGGVEAGVYDYAKTNSPGEGPGNPNACICTYEGLSCPNSGTGDPECWGAVYQPCP